MNQKYVPDGTWLICSEGKMKQNIKVHSQKSVYIHGRLAATKYDRTGKNFNCLKMAIYGAIIGAIVAVAIIASGGLAAILAAGVATCLTTIMTGALVGGIAATALAFVPCICSMLTRPYDWTVIHSRVKFEGKNALLHRATLTCFLGGINKIIQPNVQEALDMCMLSNRVYNTDDDKDGKNDQSLPNGWNEVTSEELKARFPQLANDRLWQDNDSGFFAQLYKNEDGRYAVVFRGTDKEKNDWVTDIKQAFGLKTDQYDKAYVLAKKVKNTMGKENVTFAGHSLGGGLASAAGAETQLPTYTFNAAGLHENTMKQEDLTIEDTRHIQAYSSDDDPLNILQDNRELLGLVGLRFFGKIGRKLFSDVAGGDAPRAVGERIGVDTDTIPLTAHSTKYIQDKLKTELGSSPDKHVLAKEL